MSIRVVHIAHSADGGAGRAARRASAACNAAGVKSLFACLHGEKLKPDEIRFRAAEQAEGGLAQVLSHRLQWGLIPGARAEGGFSLFSIAYPGVDILSHPAIRGADIVHLHWPSWTVTPPAIRRLLEAGKTVFLTLHDMWFFTGGCHYAGDCRQFATACMKCPQMADRLGIASANFEDKLAAYGGGHPGLHVISLCRWMQDLARSSRILGDAVHHLVPNPVETDLFAPTDRDFLRAEMGIGPGDAVLLFGNFDNSETRKGFHILRDALEMFAASPEVRDFGGDIFLMSFGRNADFAVPEPLRGINVGLVDDDAVLAGIYGMADLLCFPSVEDNYPNSIVEAAACGTPAVAFRTGGMADMIRHGETGILADELGDAVAYAGALRQALTRLHGNAAARAACRRQTLETNGMARIGARLREVYAKALDRRETGPRTGPETGQGAGDGPDRRLLRDRMFSHMLLENDIRLGAAFARFPVSRFLGDNGISDLDRHVVRLGRHPARPAGAGGDAGEGRFRILAVRTFHEHHSAFSGPYQFLRHLPPEEFEIANVLVPMGDDFAGDAASQALKRDLGRLIGAAPFGTQPNAWIAEWEIARILRRERFDLVHFMDGELNGWLLSRLPADFFAGGRRPVFLTMLHQPEHLAAEWTSAAALARFDMLGAVAEHQAEWLRSFVPGVPVRAVHHGVDVDFFCPAEREAAGRERAEGPRRLLAVGHWLRDYDLAFAALERLVARGVALEYRVVCHSLDRPSLPSWVTLLSGLSDAELREEYRAADLVFLPLQAATANNALLEGMACGTPVVSTDVGGVSEYVPPQAGHLCPPGDPDACADVLQTLLGDPGLLAEMGRQARAGVQRFDWRAIAGIHARTYRELIASRQDGAAADARPERERRTA